MKEIIKEEYVYEGRIEAVGFSFMGITKFDISYTDGKKKKNTSLTSKYNHREAGEEIKVFIHPNHFSKNIFITQST
ncbi:MAG: hypothetical protein ABGY95_11410 [Rubritalea sp.]|uniref:hypothetical protein n=1 Tax=Rubritalea sp. TaxID=2109375 RepID=UPI00324212D9